MSKWEIWQTVLMGMELILEESEQFVLFDLFPKALLHHLFLG